MTERADMHSVSEVLVPGFGRSWHECVAIVQEAGSMLHGGVTLPDATDLFFEDNGTISFGFGSESSQDPVTGLATLLQQLLDGVEAPEALVQLAAENSGSNPAHRSVEGFVRALAFFERPNRANDLRAISSRIRGFQHKSPTEEEFEKLRERIAAKSERVQESKAGEEKKDKKKRAIPRLTRKQQQVAAVALVGGVLFALVLLRGNTVASMGSAVDRVEIGLASVISRGLDRFGVSGQASAPSPSEPVENITGRPAAAKGQNRQQSSRAANGRVGSSSRPGSAGARASRSAAAQGSEGGFGRTPLAMPLPSVPLMPIPAAPGDALPLPVAGVFSLDTPGISPPVLLRPQMPKDPPPGADTGYFDMLVDENGTVEEVKLISPRRRYHDRMLVAAAKAWKFRPAVLDGRPVKVRIRIPIILSGLP